MGNSEGFMLNRPFEVGDTVEIIGGQWFEIGDIGSIKEIDDPVSYLVDVKGQTLYIFKDHLKMVGGNVYEEDGV